LVTIGGSSGGTRRGAALRALAAMLCRWLAFQRSGGADEPDQEFIRVWRAITRTWHLTWTSTLGTRALPPRLPAHGPVVRLAGAARAQRCIQRRGDLGAAARGSGPAPPGRPPEAGLG